MVGVSGIDPDALHRTVKLELDEDRATSLEEAIAIASHYVLQIDVGPQIAGSPTLQAMLMTAVNTAARAFLGGVRVRAATNPLLSTRWAAGQTLTDAIRTYGGQPTTELSEQYPTLVIGHPQAPVGRPLLHLTWNGWVAAAVRHSARRLPEAKEFPLAGVVAAGLGVSETFQHVRGSTRAGWRDVGLSLWQPGAGWRSPTSAGPVCPYLPQRLLMAGLGHLGQAICWALGFLPYPETDAADLTLYDFDTIIDANHSTGLLTTPADRGRRKTRVIAQLLEQIGFTTAIIERRVDGNTRRTVDEPTWALAGFDRPEPRRALANAGFSKVIDVGLGAGRRDYLDILIHVFPSGIKPAYAWPPDAPANTEHPLTAAYQSIVRREIAAGVPEGTARCGVVGLAGQSVAAAFVGTVAAGLAIAEALRELLGGTAASIPSYEVVSVSLANPARVDTAANRYPAIVDNPGFVQSAGC
jgi:hypothetical protein